MSPILLRPIREQFEHSRLIRLLQTRLRRRYLVRVNLGDEREATGVRSGAGLVHPDLVLTNTTGAKRLHGVVEVETAESVNHLEAMSEWVHLGKVRGAFYLYVPAGATDVARRLCEHYKIAVTEIWSYHAVGDQMRFTMTFRSARAASRAVAAARRVAERGNVASKAPSRRAGTAKRAVTSTTPTTKPAKRTPKAAEPPPTTARRAVDAAKRATKTATHTVGPRSDGSVVTTSVAKATKATTRTINRVSSKMATSGKRRASSDRETSTRASTWAASSVPKTFKQSTGAGTKKTAAASSRSRKRR